MTDSPFGPVRKWGNEPERWDPNDMLALDDATGFDRIRRILGETYVTDQLVIHEPSAEEREMARLEATFPALREPTNTFALQQAPVIPVRNSVFRGIAFGLMGSLIIAAAVVGVVNVALWVMS